MFFKLALSVLLSSVALTQATSYEGYKLYDINAKNNFEKEILLRLSDNPEYDFFILPREIGVPARVMIQPQDQMDFESSLNKFGVEFSVANDNVGQSVALERMQNNFLRSAADLNDSISFTAFHRHNEINAYLDQLAKSYPARVNVKTIGKSYEGRDMKTITITNGDGVPNKKVILVDGGIHAREWISPAVALYIINQLVENYAAHTNLLKTYDWVILPVVNPDGYEYTFTKTRMWRTTRKPVTSLCTGTDANRNFDFHWGEKGASPFPCVETYRGEKPFSEPETQVLRDLMHSLTGRAKMYLTLHSFGKYMLYPWGYTRNLPNTWEDLHEVAQAGADAIRASTGTVYRVGSSTNLLSEGSGGSDDYAYGAADIPISITMELPGGGTGFDPSPAQISPFVKESWTGVVAMAEKVIEKY